jgi:prevent-host-death family protein
MRVNVAEAKARLSELLRRVKAGETVIISERNVPVAELRGLSDDAGMRSRTLRVLWPEWAVADSYFEPLPADVLDAFEGK